MPFSQILNIRTSDCDSKLFIKPSAVLDLFQETAGRHCIPYKLDSPTLISEKGVTWVLSGVVVRFLEFPKWPETVEVKTWARTLKGFKAHRDYTILNKDSKSIIQGSSQWALLDINKRRPVRIEDINNGMEIETDLTQFENIIPGKFDKPSNYADTGTIIKVNVENLDLNNHVSNIEYIKWLFLYINKEFLKIKTLYFMNISFCGESYLGDELILKKQNIENKGYYSFFNKSSNKEVCVIYTEWI